MRDTIRDDGFIHAVIRTYPLDDSHLTVTPGHSRSQNFPIKTTAGSNMDAVFDPTCHTGTSTRAHTI